VSDYCNTLLVHERAWDAILIFYISTVQLTDVGHESVSVKIFM
jgi:hypothetical protein